MRRQPFILLSFSSSKKARKAQETQSYQRFHASVIRTSRVSQTPPQTPPPYFYQWVSHGKKWSWRNRLQMAHVCLHSRKWVHTRPSEKNRTQGLTRRNRGVSDGGGITTLGLFHTLRKPCVAGCQNGKLCRFGILAGRCSRRTQKAFGTAMRLCVSLFRRRRGPAGLRNLFSHLQKLQFSCPTHEVFCTCMVCLPMMISILPITCSSSNLRTAHFASAFLFLQYLLLAVLLRLPAALTIHFACD